MQYFSDDFGAIPAGNLSLTSALIAAGYSELENGGNPGNVAILARASLPSRLTNDPRFLSASSKQVLRFVLPASDVESRLLWSGFPAGVQTVSVSWWEYRDAGNLGGEKFCRVGNFVAGPGSNRRVDSIITLGQASGTTLIANSANMHDYGDHSLSPGISGWPGLNHFEAVYALSTGTNADGSVSLYQNGTLVGQATGLQFFDTASSTGFQLWDIGGWSSTGGGTEGPVTYPIVRYICAVRIASARQGVWPMGSVAPINILVTLAPNPDGSLSTANPQGDASPDPSILAVNKSALQSALGSLAGLTTGSAPLSFNLRNAAWLSGSEFGTCTFALVTVSGDSASAKNWSISGATLAQPLTSTSSDGAGVFELRAISSTGGVLSLGIFSWSILEPVSGADVLAPNVPLGLIVTPAQNALNCTCDPSADNYDNATAPSGLHHYTVYVDGVVNQTVAAVKNPALQMQVTNIGPITSPAPPVVIAANGLVILNAAGTGIHGVTADQCAFYNAALTGDFTVTAQLGAFDSPYQYSTSGIMIRETLDPSSIMTALYVQPQTPGNGAQLKQRSNAGSTSANVATVAGYKSGYARFVRSGTNITSFLSSDGLTFTPVGTQTLPMSAQVFVGAFLSSQQAGTSITSTFAQINITTAPKVSFSFVTTGTHTVAVAAVDTNGNASQPGPSVTATASGTVVTPPTQGKIRFNGGIYIYLDRNMSLDQRLQRMQYFSQFPFVRGFQDFTFWAPTWENPNATAPGDYSGSWDSSGRSGIGYVKTMVNQCYDIRPSDPMRMMFHVSTYGFSGSNKSSTSFPTSFVPKYLGNSAYGPSNAVETSGVWGGVWINTKTMTTQYGANVGYFTRWWVPAVMDAMLAMIGFYGSQVDNPDPTKDIPHADLVEMVSFIGESVIPTYCTYSDAAGIAQYQRYMPGVRARFPTCALRWWGSWLQDNSLIKQVVDLCIANYWTIGGPDCVNETGTGSRVFAANRAYRGINPVTGLSDSSYTNYVNKGSWISEFEPDEEGPRAPGPGNAQMGDNNWADYIAQAAQQGANYTTFFDMGWTGNNDKRFLNFLSSQPLHPQGIDALQSLGTDGKSVNGSVAMGTLSNFRRYPTSWPT